MTPLDRFVMAFAVNAAGQACLVAAAAAVALRVARASAPSYRHRLAAGALVLTVALPLATAWRPMAGEPDPSAPWPMASPSSVLAIAPRPVSVVVALYAAVCLWQVLRFSRSAIATARIRRRAIRLDDGPIYDEALRCFRAWGIAPLRLCTSTDVTVPVLCGVRAPAIILPVDLAADDPALIRGIIGHEIAHRVRRDIPVAVGLELALMPVAWHPAVTALKRAAAFDRELACDELAIERLGLARTGYAAALLRLAERRSTPAPCAARIDAHPAGALERRIAAILRARPDGSPAGLSRAVAVAVTVAVVAVGWKGAVAIVDPVGDALSGVWRLDTRESERTVRLPFRSLAMDVRAADAFIHIDQRRTRRDGVFEQVTLHGATDGRPFDVTMPSGVRVSATARWRGQRLLIDAALGSRVIEHAEAFRKGPNLIINQKQPGPDGGATYTYVFSRVGRDVPQ